MCTGKFWKRLIVAQGKKFLWYFLDLSIYCHEYKSSITFFEYVYKSNPVVGCMLVGVIIHKPTQVWMIILTGLTGLSALWSVLSFGCCTLGCADNPAYLDNVSLSYNIQYTELYYHTRNFGQLSCNILFDFYKLIDEESARGAKKSWQVVLKEYDTVSGGGVSTWYFYQTAMESLLCFHSVCCVVRSELVKSQRWDIRTNTIIMNTRQVLKALWGKPDLTANS